MMKRAKVGLLSRYSSRISFYKPHQDCLVNLRFSEPASLFCGEEHLKTAKMRIENEKGKAKEEKMTKKFVDQTLTATRSPLHLANQTSPYLGIENQN